MDGSGSRFTDRAARIGAADLPIDLLGPPKKRPRRSVTIDEILIWAYADQQVHRYLRRPIDWFLFALEEEGVISDPHDRRPVHRDAALVHEAVLAPITGCADQAHAEKWRSTRRGIRCGRCEETAHLIFHMAATRDRPERCTVEPRAVPLEPMGRFDDFGWYEDRYGRRRQYVLLTAEIITVEEDEWRLDGRKKMKRGRPRRNTRVEVKYAPIGWEPSPEYIAMTNDIADRWTAELARLEAALTGAEFRAHVLERRS